MMDERLGLLALRARALSVTVATTGSTTLSATAAGFARASGSFVADGFTVGQEVLPAGFSTANNAYGVISSVSALNLGIFGGRAVQAAASGRSIVAGLPEGRAWENVEYARRSGRPYIADDFIPGTATLWTVPADGGRVEETGLYRLTLFGLTGYGAGALRDTVSALKRLFAPGQGLGVLSDGSVLRVGTNPGPYSGQILRIEGGWSALTLTIPWSAQSENVLVALAGVGLALFEDGTEWLFEDGTAMEWEDAA